MNKVIIGVIFAFAGAIIVYNRDNILIQGLTNENKKLNILIERLKYENNKRDKLFKKKILKESFDILKYNMYIKKPKIKDDEILFKSDSSDSFEELNQKTESESKVDSSDSDSDSNSDSDSSKSKIDLSSLNLVWFCIFNPLTKPSNDVCLLSKSLFIVFNIVII